MDSESSKEIKYTPCYYNITRMQYLKAAYEPKIDPRNGLTQN